MSSHRPMTMQDADAILREDYFQDEAGEWIDPETEMPKAEGSFRLPPDVAERCRKYVSKMDPAIAGQGGHDSAWHAAQAIFRGFALPKPQGWPILLEFNSRCSPPWTEADLEHKADDALEKSKLPHGYILLRSQARQPFAPQVQTRRIEEPAKIDFKKAIGVEAFPLQVFPPMLERLCKEIATSIGCPVDYPATTMIAVAASAMGNTRQIRIKRGWKEGPRFYMAVVADPGAAKSPVIKVLCKPIYKRQEWLHSKYMEEREEYDRKVMEYESGCKQAKRLNSVPPNKPNKPNYPHLFTTNSTTEKLAVMLSENPRGLVMVQDELTSWVMGLNQYKAGGKGSDRQFFLSAWSGEASKTDRKGDDTPTFTPRPFLNIIGGIQPDMLRSLMDEEGREDGFVHRILFSFPESKHGEFWTDQDVSLECQNAWDSTISHLLELQMMETQRGEVRPFDLMMTDQAKDIWRSWFNHTSAEVGCEDFPYHLRGPWSKLRAYCARFALLFQFLWTGAVEPSAAAQLELTPRADGDERIGAWAMSCAAYLTEYFKSHYRKVASEMTKSSKEKIIEKAMGFIAKKGGKVSAKEFVHAHFAKKVSEAAGLMKEMAERGLGKTWETENGNKTKTTWFQTHSGGEIKEPLQEA